MSPLSCVSPPSAFHKASLAFSHMGRAPSTTKASGPSWEGLLGTFWVWTLLRAFLPPIWGPGYPVALPPTAWDNLTA